MTRKDYILIARCLKAARDSMLPNNLNAREGIRQAALLLAAELAQENARFNVSKFLEAAGAHL